MTNNPAQDRYNPPGVRDGDGWESGTFDSLNTGELFWLNENKNEDNHAYRKISETEAFNTKTGETLPVVKRNAVVYYKS